MNIKIQNGSPLTIGISGSQQTPWGQISGIFTAIYVHFYRLIELAINSHTNPYNFASRSLLRTRWDPYKCPYGESRTIWESFLSVYTSWIVEISLWLFLTVDWPINAVSCFGNFSCCGFSDTKLGKLRKLGFPYHHISTPLASNLSLIIDWRFSFPRKM